MVQNMFCGLKISYAFEKITDFTVIRYNFLGMYNRAIPLIMFFKYSTSVLPSGIIFLQTEEIPFVFL